MRILWKVALVKFALDKFALIKELLYINIIYELWITIIFTSGSYCLATAPPIQSTISKSFKVALLPNLFSIELCTPSWEYGQHGIGKHPQMRWQQDLKQLECWKMSLDASLKNWIISSTLIDGLSGLVVRFPPMRPNDIREPMKSCFW